MYTSNRVRNTTGLRVNLSRLITVALLLLCFAAGADHEVFKTRQGVVIYGFDPVAYFTLGKAKEGSKGITSEFLGGTWRFASEQNRQLFLANPGKYIPQYGGHCAWGIKSDPHIEPEPTQFRVVEGKLYLFNNAPANSRWDIKHGHTQIANRKWEEQKAFLLQQ